MIKEIPLTKGYVAFVDECDYERVSQFEWHTTERFRFDRSLGMYTPYGPFADLMAVRLRKTCIDSSWA
jgi:hypothetical protein